MWLYQRRAAFEDRYGPWPHPCHFCTEPVLTAGNGGRGRGTIPDAGCIHHIDGDHDNDVPENWAAAHQRCHHVHHMTQAGSAKAKTLSALGNLNGRAGKLGGANSFGRDRERAAEMGRRNGPAAAARVTSLRRRTTCGFESNCGNVAKHVRAHGCEIA